MSKNKEKKEGPGITRTRHDTIMNYCPGCQGCQVVRLPSPMPVHASSASFFFSWRLDGFFSFFFFFIRFFICLDLAGAKPFLLLCSVLLWWIVMLVAYGLPWQLRVRHAHRYTTWSMFFCHSVATIELLETASNKKWETIIIISDCISW